MSRNTPSLNKPVNQVTTSVEAGRKSIIVTHSGPFHADDVIACALVRTCFPREFQYADIVRTRDEETLHLSKWLAAEKRAVMVDVGGEYSPDGWVFDHHFLGSPEREEGGKYASAGLVEQSLRDIDRRTVIAEVCRLVDAADSGEKVGEGWTLSKTIHECNPQGGAATEEFDERFEVLVNTVCNVLEQILFDGVSLTVEEFQQAVENNYDVRTWVAEHRAALESSAKRVREAFEQPGQILELAQYEPALMDTAPEAPEGKLFSVFPSPGGEWMVQQIPREKGSFAGRKRLPSLWAGKRGADLDAVTGIEGCIFVHPGRFIGGHKTLDGALGMALLATTAED
jgi:uncharacterized UPF0160 family protein